MNPVFYLYNDKNNLLDSLIEEFKSRSWCYGERKQPYFHKYPWPDIVLSDREASYSNPLLKGQDDIIELLGSYDPLKNQVVLYMPKIRATAENFHNENKEKSSLSFEANIENLCTLILLHEFTHWIVHKGIFPTSESSDSEPIRESLYEDEDQIYFHEAVAQIFTNYFCKKDNELSKLFDWLEKKQPKQYQVYKQLLLLNGVEFVDSSLVTEKTCHLTVCNTFIDEAVFALMVLALKEDKVRQSFDNFEKIVKQIRGGIDDSFFKHQVIACFTIWSLDLNIEDAKKKIMLKKKGQIPAKKFGL